MSARVDPNQLTLLQKNTANIRNFCILAHVDHGKTTLSDSLVSSNGLFSAKLAGKLRFLDSTEEEQQRGITMHSSAISLLYSLEKLVVPSQEIIEDKSDNNYLINLIDCPGHIDFSSDVSTATRLCDGALIVIDVLEGLCTQTHAVLYKALKERMRPCLVLNKIDRLCLEAKLTTLEAFHHLRRIVENVNALSASLLNSELRKMTEDNYYDNKFDEDNPLVQDWNFQPEKGNVIFASALDCWGFGLIKFANIWSKKLNINNKILQKYLFEDYYLNPTSKKLVKCEPSDKPMFATLILEPIWQLYNTAIEQNDPEKAAKMAFRGCGVELQPREISTKDPRSTIQAIFRKWLSLPDAILRMVVRCMPNPIDAQKLRLTTLTSQVPTSSAITSLAKSSIINRIACINKQVEQCAAAGDTDVVVFISKMMPMRVAELSPRDKNLYLERIRKKQSPNPTNDENSSVSNFVDGNQEVFIALARVFSGVLKKTSKLYVLNHRYNPLNADLNFDDEQNIDDWPIGELNETLPLLKKVSSDSFGMYLCLGPSFSPVEEVPAGNIVGIVGLEDDVLKTATLSSTWAYLPMNAITFQAKPMVCVAIEPKSHFDLPKLEYGLQLLYQYDPVVEIGVDDSGQHTMTCLGELHLEQCLKSLKEKYAKCDLVSSEPLVFYREGVLSSPSPIPPIRANITPHTATALPPPWSDLDGIENSVCGRCKITMPGNNLIITLRCFPLPSPLLSIFESEMSSVSNVSGNSNSCSNISPLHLLNDFINSNPLSGDRCIPEEDRDIFMIWNRILLGIKEANNSGGNVDAEFQLGSDIENIDYRELLQRVISVGPKNIMSNIILLSKELTINVHSGSTLSRELYPTKDGSLDASINSNENTTQVTSLNKSTKTGIFYKILQRLANAIASGFQLASYQGSLMHQPMHGIGFSIESIDISRLAIPFISDEEIDLPTNISSVDNINTINMGQLIADVKYSLRISMLSLPTRVIEPIYSCDLQCDQSQLGNLYPVLAKRRGEIYKEDIIEGTSLFLISAYLPVSESFGFATELLKKTSGAATTPTLQFSQWRMNSVDPFWKPTTIEELEDFGSDVAEPNIMRSYIDKVRKRKGLVVEEKVVASAEKQRTLTKNK